MMANLSCLRDLFNRERGVLYDLSSDAFQVLAGKGSRAVKIELMLTPHCYCAQQSALREVHLSGLLAVKPILCFICRINFESVCFFLRFQPQKLLALANRYFESFYSWLF